MWQWNCFFRSVQPTSLATSMPSTVSTANNSSTTVSDVTTIPPIASNVLLMHSIPASTSAPTLVLDNTQATGTEFAYFNFE